MKRERESCLDADDVALLKGLQVDDRVTWELRQARALIEKHGWVRGEWGAYARGFCITGALRMVGAGRGAFERLVKAAGKLPRAITVYGNVSRDEQHVCIAYNDSRTEVADILAWIDRAIALT